MDNLRQGDGGGAVASWSRIHNHDAAASHELQTDRSHVKLACVCQDLQNRIQARLPDLNTLLLLWQKLSKDSVSFCAEWVRRNHRNPMFKEVIGQG